MSSWDRFFSVRLVLTCAAFCALTTTAFSSGPEQVVYSFAAAQGDIGGAFPAAGLVADAAGNLYGTNRQGGEGVVGDCDCGAVFELSPPVTAGGDWIRTVIHIFSGGEDGAFPVGTLILDNAGNLYGTTRGEDRHTRYDSKGTVFEFSPPSLPGGVWTETIIWNFDPVGGVARGFEPSGKLVMDALGNLYGTAHNVGNVDACPNCGLVFELVKPRTAGGSWKERVLYEFGAVSNDGTHPAPNLLLRGGILYGTTDRGGASDKGTVFQLTRESGLWAETILHSFDGADGIDPHGGLIADPGGNMLILDTSEIQARKPDPQVHEVARMTWDSASIPQNAMPFTEDGHPYILEFDESTAGTTGGGDSNAVGAGRIIDIADEAHPHVVSNLRLQVDQHDNHAAAANDPGASSPVQGYAAHYCNIPSRVDPLVVACSFIASGLRVFDISDLDHPKEIAYWVAPSTPRMENRFDGSNFAMSQPAFAPGRQIWYTDGGSGFYNLRVDESVWPGSPAAGRCAGKKATVVGTNGKDKLKGTKGRDVISAGGGDDTVRGLKGSDRVCGGNGKDKIAGGPGRDKLRSGAGNDTLLGVPGQDKLEGGAGKNDRLNGGPGKDFVRQ